MALRGLYSAFLAYVRLFSGRDGKTFAVYKFYINAMTASTVDYNYLGPSQIPDSAGPL